MNLLDVEAYSLPSSSFVKNDSHVFVVTLDRHTEWRNKGGGWGDSRPHTLQAKVKVYKEWIMDFVPPNDIDKCGIAFFVNGICQTYANRELLLAEHSTDIRTAPKNEVATFIFGKYGLGLDKLKDLLTKSFNKVSSSSSVLVEVLSRVDNYVDDELLAWRLVAISYTTIPVDALIAKSPQAGINIARQKLSKLVHEREVVYDKYLDGQINSDTLHKNIIGLILSHSKDYLTFLANIGYITERDKDKYVREIEEFSHLFVRNLVAQRQIFEATGVVNDNFLNNI